MPRIALYPGSFDPVTNGHLTSSGIAVGLCDRLLSPSVHPGKKPLFSTEERLEMVKEVFGPVGRERRMRLRLRHLLTTYGLQRAKARRCHHPHSRPADGTDLDTKCRLPHERTMAPEVGRCSCRLADGSPDHRHTGASDRGWAGDVSNFVPKAVAKRLRPIRRLAFTFLF